MKVLDPKTYCRKRCAKCSKPMRGFAHRDGGPSYCGDKCARKAQPDKVIVGAGKG